MTEQTIAEIRQKLDNAKEAYDRAVGHMDSLKAQMMEIKEIKDYVASGKTFGEAVKTHLTELKAELSQLEADETALTTEFMRKYAELLEV